MTREEAVEELKRCAALAEKPRRDIETAHAEGDACLVNFLRDLGYADVVDEWAKIRKWYA